jgi:hypothetical protein
MGHAAEAEAKRISREEGFGSAGLWFGVLGGPIAWVFHMVIGYSLEEWFACSPSATSTGEILGMDVRSVAILITIVFGAIAASAALVSLLHLRRASSSDEDARSRRVRWMAIVGLMNSGLYLLIILGGFGPAFLLDVCEVSP